MATNKEVYGELIGLLEDLSPDYIYSLLDECMYDLVLVSEQLGNSEGLGSRYIALRQLRDTLGQMPFKQLA